MLVNQSNMVPRCCITKYEKCDMFDLGSWQFLDLGVVHSFVYITWQLLSLLTHRGPVDLRKWAIFNTILMSPKSWLSQEDLDAGCEHSMVPVDS